MRKWRSGSVVRVWATGKENYIRAFSEMLDEQLAPLLSLSFEWVDDENDADLVAILGVSKSDMLSERWPSCPDFWGCGGTVDVKGGTVRKADLIVYHWDKHDRFLNDYPTFKRMVNGILLHEALHGLAPTGHPERSKVVLSIMQSAGYLTFIDKAILRLNSHPLIEPGMTMSEVRELIVFEDELPDQSPEEALTGYDILERAFFNLQKVDTVRMEIRGDCPVVVATADSESGSGRHLRSGALTNQITLDWRTSKTATTGFSSSIRTRLPQPELMDGSIGNAAVADGISSVGMNSWTAPHGG